MRSAKLVSLAALVAVLSAGSVTRSAPAPATLPGFDVGWIKGKYATGLTSTFDPADWQRVFGRASAAGAKVVRVWILEGTPISGVLWDKNEPHLPVGVDPALLQNIPAVAAIAQSHGLTIYWTLMDGNLPTSASSQLDKDRLWNVCNGDWGVGVLWRQNVLGPILDAIAQTPSCVYAIDILNEVEGPLSGWYFRGSWLGARQFIRDTASFVHARAPGLRVSSSAGWGDAPWDILLGYFDGLGLDLLDIHAYDDQGSIPLGDLLAAHAFAKGVPIVLGECGQLSKGANPTLQATVVSGFLADAKRLGFEAALAWRLEDEDPTYTYFDGATPRPALAAFTWSATH